LIEHKTFHIAFYLRQFHLKVSASFFPYEESEIFNFYFVEMKVSDWLETKDPRGIWDDNALRILFEQGTGKPAPWELNETCSMEQTMATILLFGGEISLAPGHSSGRTIDMVQVAVAAAKKFTPHGWSPKCIGRGSRHRECIERLRAFDR